MAMSPTYILVLYIKSLFLSIIHQLYSLWHRTFIYPVFFSIYTFGNVTYLAAPRIYTI